MIIDGNQSKIEQGRFCMSGNDW